MCATVAAAVVQEMLPSMCQVVVAANDAPRSRRHANASGPIPKPNILKRFQTLSLNTTFN